MKPLMLCLVLLLCGWLVSPAHATMPPMPLGLEDQQRLAIGEIVVKSRVPEDGSKGNVSAAVLIPAQPCSVWQVMLDYENAPQFVPGLYNCRILERHPRHDIIEHTVDMYTLLPRVTYVYRADYDKPRRIDFMRIRGDLREMFGTWSLQPARNGRQTLLTYSVYLDPGFLVPQWMVRFLLESDLPDLMNAIRDRVNAVKSKHDC